MCHTNVSPAFTCQLFQNEWSTVKATEHNSLTPHISPHSLKHDDDDDHDGRCQGTTHKHTQHENLI